MLPIRNMRQKPPNLRPLDVQKIINKLVTEPGPQYTRLIQRLNRLHQRIRHRRLVGLPVRIP